MRESRLLVATVALALVFAVSCGDDATSPAPVDAGQDGDAAAGDVNGDVAPEDDAVDDVTSDVAADTDVPVDPNNPGLERAPTQQGVDPEGVDTSEVPAAGEVVVGKMRSGDPGFGGPQAKCKVDDFIMANAVAHFCIEGLVSDDRIFFDGGRIADAEPIDVAPPAGTNGRDRLDLISNFINLGAQSSAVIEVVRDGSEGLAVLRVTGKVEPSMYIAGVVGPEFFPVPDIDVETEYRLAPDSKRLEVVTFLINSADRDRNLSPGDLLFWGDTIQYVFPGSGTTIPDGSQGVIGYGEDVAYGWFNDTPTSSLALAGISLPAVPIMTASMVVPPGQTGVIRRHFFTDVDVAGVFEELLRELPAHPTAGGGRYVSANVEVTRGGAPLAAALVHFTALDDNSEPVGDQWYGDYTNAAGQTRLVGLPGRYEVAVEDANGIVSTEIVTLAADVTLTLAVPEGGLVRLAVTEQLGDQQVPAPAKVWFYGAHSQRLIFVLRGAEEVTLPVGDWTWEASRGTEFTAVSGQLTLEEGSTVDLPISLERVVPTPGLIAGEFHQHSSPSMDSTVALADRLLSNIGEGVDFAVSSDHDTVSDFQPIIEELEATDLIASMSGTEVSPLYGHFGLYPVEMRSAAPAHGGLPLAYKDEAGEVRRYTTGAELHPAMRAIAGTRMIQLNHARDTTSYFRSNHWDFNTPMDTADPGMSWDFDTMELINGDNCAQILDWFSLQNQGFRVVGVGNSDTHSLTTEPGYPRNYFPADVASPTEITSDVIIDGILSGDVVVSAGVILEFDGPPGSPESVRPGHTVVGPSVEANLRVSTPPWVEAQDLAVFRNGTLVDTYSIGAGPGAIVDFDGPITLDAGDEDAWFVLMAYSQQTATIVYKGEAIFAIANPIFVDADESGTFDAPGLLPLEPASVPVLCD